VSIANLAFNPSSIDVKVGDTVTWTNNDNVGHTVTGDGGLDSGTIEPGGTFSKKFDTAGTYQYHCSVHPSMTGTVVVK
jgi:plastocyanin